jgi:hypothetical protein
VQGAGRPAYAGLEVGRRIDADVAADREAEAAKKTAPETKP